MPLRDINQWQQISDETEPDNYITPDQRSDLEKKTLKDAVATIERLQGVLKSIFPVL